VVFGRPYPIKTEGDGREEKFLEVYEHHFEKTLGGGWFQKDPFSNAWVSKESIKTPQG